MTDIRLKVAGSVFLAVAVLHLVRLMLKWQITIAGTTIPMSASVIGFAVAGLLALWMLKPCSGKRQE